MKFPTPKELKAIAQRERTATYKKEFNKAKMQLLALLSSCFVNDKKHLDFHLGYYYTYNKLEFRKTIINLLESKGYIVSDITYLGYSDTIRITWN